MAPKPKRSRDITFPQVIAGYLSLVLLLQGLAAAIALGAGPLHHHRPAAPAGASLATVAFSHHAQAHATGQRHHHDAQDGSVVADADASEAIDEAAIALTAALALLALDTPRLRHDPRRHIWRATLPWALGAAWSRLQFRPPRIG